jgi:hypothetical protein
LSVGSHTITAIYGGDSNYAAATSGPVTEVVIPATAVTLTVTSAGNPVTTVPAGSAITLRASVQSGGAPVTSGTVNFCDASAAYCTDIHLLGTAQLTSAGTAAIKFIPGIGNHAYRAVFAGTTSMGASASGTVSMVVTGLYVLVASNSASGNVGNYSLSAVVGGLGPVAPTGTVQFLDSSNGNALVGTGLLSTSLLPPGVTSPMFLDASNPAVSQNINAVAVGDFNGDGILDMALANFGSNSVTILLGDWAGNFTATASSPATGDSPIAIAAGDFNGDGNLDLAVANYGDGTVTILLGDGKGNFTATATSPATGVNPASIVTADFNGDGIPDLATANYGSNNVTVLLGKGDGTFTPTSASPATGLEPNSIVVADLNSDGKPDLAIANFKSKSVTVLLGNGDGAFAVAQSPATGNGPYSIAVADFDGDGIPDLVTANYDDNTATMLRGSGSGSFTASPVTVPTDQYPIAVAIGDFNGDGRPDFAVANYYDVTMSVELAEARAPPG